MPNGSPDFYEKELPVLEAFFAPMADVLNEFGSSHNLILERYYHESPSWRFNFRHPKGGVASLDVMRESANSIKIHLYWWVDDYDTFTRFIRSDETPSYGIKSAEMSQILEQQLRAILSWVPGEWTQVATGYEQFWKPQGRKWFEQDVKRYPIPKV